MALYDDLTYKREKAFIKELTTGYTSALKNIRKDLDKVYASYSKDGVLMMSEMQKYDRLIELQKKINAELSSLNRGTYSMHKSYLSDVFEENYYVTGYLLESETAKDISYSLLNRQAIYESVLTPMDKIALQDNAAAITSI